MCAARIVEDELRRHQRQQNTTPTIHGELASLSTVAASLKANGTNQLAIVQSQKEILSRLREYVAEFQTQELAAVQGIQDDLSAVMKDLAGAGASSTRGAASTKGSPGSQKKDPASTESVAVRLVSSLTAVKRYWEDARTNKSHDARLQAAHTDPRFKSIQLQLPFEVVAATTTSAAAGQMNRPTSSAAIGSASATIAPQVVATVSAFVASAAQKLLDITSRIGAPDHHVEVTGSVEDVGANNARGESALITDRDALVGTLIKVLNAYEAVSAVTPWLESSTTASNSMPRATSVEEWMSEEQFAPYNVLLEELLLKPICFHFYPKRKTFSVYHPEHCTSYLLNAIDTTFGPILKGLAHSTSPLGRFSTTTTAAAPSPSATSTPIHHLLHQLRSSPCYRLLAVTAGKIGAFVAETYLYSTATSTAAKKDEKTAPTGGGSASNTSSAEATTAAASRGAVANQTKKKKMISGDAEFIHYMNTVLGFMGDWQRVLLHPVTTLLTDKASMMDEATGFTVRQVLATEGVILTPCWPSLVRAGLLGRWMTLERSYIEDTADSFRVTLPLQVEAGEDQRKGVTADGSSLLKGAVVPSALQGNSWRQRELLSRLYSTTLNADADVLSRVDISPTSKEEGRPGYLRYASILPAAVATSRCLAALPHRFDLFFSQMQAVSFLGRRTEKGGDGNDTTTAAAADNASSSFSSSSCTMEDVLAAHRLYDRSLISTSSFVGNAVVTELFQPAVSAWCHALESEAAKLPHSAAAEHPQRLLQHAPRCLAVEATSAYLARFVEEWSDILPGADDVFAPALDRLQLLSSKMLRTFVEYTAAILSPVTDKVGSASRGLLDLPTVLGAAERMVLLAKGRLEPEDYRLVAEAVGDALEGVAAELDRATARTRDPEEADAAIRKYEGLGTSLELSLRQMQCGHLLRLYLHRKGGAATTAMCGTILGRRSLLPSTTTPSGSSKAPDGRGDHTTSTTESSAAASQHNHATDALGAEDKHLEEEAADDDEDDVR